MAKQNNYAKENNTFMGRNNILECILLRRTFVFKKTVHEISTLYLFICVHCLYFTDIQVT